MRLRRAISGVVLVALAASAALAPSVARACELTDPGCYIDDFAHQQVRELALSIWQLNRAGLVLARWVEDLRIWLTETVLVDAFTALVGPARWMFFLALIIAWMIFVISFMVQALVDLRWVDLRRASRPIVLALLIFAKGGELMQQSEHIRLLGSGMLQGIAQSVVPENAPENSPKRVPAISMVRSGDLPDQLKPLYMAESSCGTKARAVPALALNDYDAYYLLSNAGDIHCAEVLQLATDFRAAFFGAESIAEMGGWQRREALSLAAQGGLRQITGLFLTAGALIEQLMHLLFALALALVWFGVLLSLVFAVFLPSEALFARQLRALLAVMRASWLASFLLGLGLAILKQVAAGGNGFVLLICGLVLIAVCLWQCRLAMDVLHSAAASTSAAIASAPQAVGGMLRSWATTGALVAGVAATGGIGTATTQIGATMARRMGRQAGDNPLARAAGRVLSHRVAARLDALTADQQIAHEADLGLAEAAWYERLPPELAPADTPARAEAARAQSRGQQARLLERRAARARQQRNFALADQLWRAAAALRPARQVAAPPPGENSAPAEPIADQLARNTPPARPTEPLARRVRQAQIAHARAATRPTSTSEHPHASLEPARKGRLRVVRRSNSMSANSSEELWVDLAQASDTTDDVIAPGVQQASIDMLGQKSTERRSRGATQAASAPSAKRPVVQPTTMIDTTNYPGDPPALDPAQAMRANVGARADLSTAAKALANPQSDAAGRASAESQAVRATEGARDFVTAVPAAPQRDAVAFASATPARPGPSAAPAPPKAAAPASLPTAAQPASKPPAPAGDATEARVTPAPAAPASAPAQISALPRALSAAPPARVPGAPAEPGATRPLGIEPQRAQAGALVERPRAPQPWKRKRGSA